MAQEIKGSKTNAAFNRAIKGINDRKAAVARNQANADFNISNWTDAALSLEGTVDVQYMDNILKQLEDRITTATSSYYDEKGKKRIEDAVAALRSREMILRKADSQVGVSQYAFSKTPLNTDNIFNK